ncbi:MAG: TonB-dependent receptor [Mucilaginibacter sp.]|uniref:TonB-dependent receptor n=1 Tax=Mucilaginibacter sp. TaxID=1882438 RepID=UPI003266647D
MKKQQPETLLLLLSLILSLFTLNVVAQQATRGNIHGQIITIEHKPAENVNVVLKDTRFGTLSDENGNYSFRVPAGTYTIVISHIGAKNQETQITVQAGQTTKVQPLIFNISATSLQEVTVSDNKTNRFAKKQSNYIARMPLKNLENPQSHSVISSELLKEQVITNFDDALKNTPGIDKLWSSTGRAGDGAGYFSLRGFAVQPTMVNGLPGLTNGGLDVANVERIEVLRGPSGTLFGSSLISYGGLINVVTKKPFESFKTEVTYTSGSFGLNRFTADVNTPLDSAKKVLLRVNAAYHDENSFQDAGFKKTRFFAPSLSYKVDDKLSFLVNAEFLAAEGTNPTMLFFDRGTALRAKNLSELGYDRNKSFTSNDLTMQNPTTTLQGQMNYRFNDQWTAQTVLSRSTAQSKGYYSYLYEISQYIPGYPNVSPTFNRYISDQNSTTSTTDIQQNFNGDIKLGPIRNRILVGLDYFSRVTINNSTGYANIGMVNMAGLETGILSKQQVDTKLSASAVDNSNTEQEVYSAYASDVVNFTSTLSAMLSLRVDHFKNGGLTALADDKYSQTALSPKFGLVYQPIADKLSVFANYMNGFSNVAPVRNTAGQTITFKPEHANQMEAGVKMNIFESKLAATVSYYNIKVSDKVRQLSPNDYVQDGENNSRGFEADITANPVPGLNIVAGYSYNNSKVVKTDATDYLGKRPEEAGPQNLVNAWISYRFEQGRIKGFGLGFGGNYASENKILNRETTGTFSLPAYTVLNSSLFYSVKAWDLAFKVDNLTNKEYYKGWSTIEPQKPRAFIASIAFKF